MSTLADIRNKVVSIVKDDGGKLTNPDDYDRIISAAMSRYSQHRPAEKVADVVGNGTHDYDLPAGWVDEFSSIRAIEFPIGNIPPELLDADSIMIYATPTGKKIRVIDYSPSASQSFRVTFTVLRTATTIPDSDVDALSWLAASLCCDEIANSYAYSGNSTIAADSVDYKSKSSEFSARAKRYEGLYKAHLGLKEIDQRPAASAVSDLDLGYPGGGDRLTHQRRLRESR